MKGPHGRYKGCCLLCTAWVRGDGRARMPVRELRKLGGRRAVKRPLRPTSE